MNETIYEVEQKFQISDSPKLEAQLLGIGAAPFLQIEQVDTYFAHPARDFGQTDEAFRLRRIGEKNYVTYKGPKIDATTKTRQEMELPLPDGGDYVGRFQSLIEALGFRVVADVSKTRRKSQLIWQEAEVEVSLDDVIGVGQYAELEIVVPEAEVPTARNRLASLADFLGLHRNERRSYLDLLLGD